MPRKFDLLIDDAKFFTSFNNLCGLFKCKDEATFKGVAYREYEGFLRTQVSLDQKSFEELKADIH